MTSGDPLARSIGVVWRRLDSPGHDAAVFAADAEGWTIEGVAAFRDPVGACSLAYSVHLDAHWRTRRARVAGWAGDRQVDLRFEVAAGGQWFLDGAPQPAVADCIDLDLGFTPATNTIPIRRLGLTIGVRHAVAAAWLRFPELSFERLDQSYRRRSFSVVDYEALEGSFRAALTVTPDGVVADYPDLWRLET